MSVFTTQFPVGGADLGRGSGFAAISDVLLLPKQRKACKASRHTSRKTALEAAAAELAMLFVAKTNLATSSLELSAAHCPPLNK
jgi:hypothetical protein